MPLGGPVVAHDPIPPALRCQLDLLAKSRGLRAASAILGPEPPRPAPRPPHLVPSPSQADWEPDRIQGVRPWWAKD